MKIGELLLGALITDWFMSQVKKKGGEPPPPPPPPKAPANATTIVPGDWFWPLPSITVDGVKYNPVISDGWGWHRKDAYGQPRLHAGADLMYQVKRKGDGERWGFSRPRELSTGGQFFAPEDLPVFAAQEGTVWRVSEGDRGITVHLVHQHGQFATLYSHLSEVIVKRGGRVGVGQALGTWGFDPSNQTVRHLHFQAGPWDAKSGQFAWTDPKPLLLRSKIAVTVAVKPPRVVS